MHIVPVRLNPTTVNLKMKKYQIMQITRLLLLVVILLIEFFGKFVWLRFATSPGNYVDEQLNYTSDIAIGNGDIFPAVVFAGSVLSAIFVAKELISHSLPVKRDTIAALCVLICNLIPVIIGMQRFNVGVVLIEVLLFLELLLPYVVKVNVSNT